MIDEPLLPQGIPDGPGGPSDSKRAGRDTVGEGMQMLNAYFLRNGCILSEDISSRVTSIIDELYGDTQIKALSAQIQSTVLNGPK